LLGRSFRCSILKLDGEENIVASYRGRDRFQDRLYVLDKNNSLHVMQDIIDKIDLFKNFYTDDAFYRWMLGGYNGIYVINLHRDSAEFSFKKPKTKKGEFGTVVSGVATDEDKKVIFSREQIGIYKYDRDANEKSEVLADYWAKGDYQRNLKIYFHK